MAGDPSSIHRYPADTTVTIEDFRRSRWKEAVDATDREGYPGLWSSLSAEARKASEEADAPRAKVLWLLADACSMTLDPENRSEPFKPYAVLEGRRSALPEDFEPDALSLFNEALPEVDQPWVRARLADLLWLLERPRKPENAVSAIDAYRSIPVNAETWKRGAEECWKRALALARTLGKAAGDRLSEMESVLIETFRQATGSDTLLALWLARILADAGLARSHSLEVATSLEVLAKSAEERGEIHRARECFLSCSDWFLFAEDGSRSAAARVGLAETWAKEARERQSTAAPSQMIAASFYEKAIQIYRTVPRTERPTHRVDERLEELRQLLADAGERSLGEMGVIRSEAIDISELIEHAREMVRGKGPVEALHGLSTVALGAQVSELREFAERMLREHPLQTLFASSHMSSDGRVIAKTPGTPLGESDSEAYRSAVHAEMVKHYTMGLGITVQGCVWPALQMLGLEHRIREGDFVALAQRSSIVPPGREWLVGKALHEGLQGDFGTALHLLVPQVEHIVRYHLKAAGVKTTNLDLEGIENEKGLGALVEAPQMKRVFSEDLTFEIDSLFCNALGPNLRNEVAHGLVDDGASQSIPSVYAWWFVLRLVFLPYWNALREAGALPSDPSNHRE